MTAETDENPTGGNQEQPAETGGEAWDVKVEIHEAILDDDAAALRRLLDGGLDVEVDTNGCGRTLLGEACVIGCPRCTELLIARGAKVGAADEDGWTPVVNAAFYGNYDCLRALIGAGADVNAATHIGDTALAMVYDAECATLLLEGGADVNHVDSDGCTPLMHAVAAGRDAVVRLLMGAGADPAVANVDGKTALDISASLWNGKFDKALRKGNRRKRAR